MTNKMTIINAETNEIIEREMTPNELKDHKATILDGLNRRNEAGAKKENAKNALLALGLDSAIASQIAGIDE